MVFFNCGNCGQGVRKNQVEKHLMSCKSNVFSCIDCSKDFYGRDYVSHNKCITEAEKYESKNYVAKANKGELKQQSWYETVLNAIQNSNPSPKAKALLQKIQDYPNIPRKKPKFMNFVRNSFKSFGLNDQVLEEVWKIIESFSTTQKPLQQQENGTQNGSKRQVEDDHSNENGNKKIKIEKVEESKCESDDTDKFKWIDEIKETLLNADNEITYKKLHKKLLKKYKSYLDTDEINIEKFSKKLDKKLKKNSISFELIQENDQINTIKLVV